MRGLGARGLASSKVSDWHGRDLVTIPSAGQSAWKSVYAGATPTVADTYAGPYEMGTQFTVSRPVIVRALQFWKGATDTGTHYGSIWNKDTGARLALVTYASETASGWQTQALTSPLTLTTGINYLMVTYHPTNWSLKSASPTGTYDAIVIPSAPACYFIATQNSIPSSTSSNDYLNDLSYTG